MTEELWRKNCLPLVSVIFKTFSNSCAEKQLRIKIDKSIKTKKEKRERERNVLLKSPFFYCRGNHGSWCSILPAPAWPRAACIACMGDAEHRPSAPAEDRQCLGLLSPLQALSSLELMGKCERLHCAHSNPCRLEPPLFFQNATSKYSPHHFSNPFVTAYCLAQGALRSWAEVSFHHQTAASGAEGDSAVALPIGPQPESHLTAIAKWWLHLQPCEQQNSWTMIWAFTSLGWFGKSPSSSSCWAPGSARLWYPAWGEPALSAALWFTLCTVFVQQSSLQGNLGGRSQAKQNKQTKNK